MSEKPDYRINLEMLYKRFPGRVSISTQEAAEVLDCCEKTIRSSIIRKNNPLPAVKITSKKFVIPIPSFARWLSGSGR